MLNRAREVLAALALLALAACASPAPAPAPGPELARDLENRVRTLCALGPRHDSNPQAMRRAEEYVAQAFRTMGLAPWFEPLPGGGRNVLASTGPPGATPRLLVGAHLDTVAQSPGADDNASGVAALMALAQDAPRNPNTPILFAVFTGEEVPHFMTESMGSLALAQSLDAQGRLPALALILDGLGWHGPPRPSPLMDNFYPGLPSPGLALIAPAKDKAALDNALAAFRTASTLPVKAFAVPDWHPLAFMSDNRPFVLANVPIILAANMGAATSPHYHAPTDTPDTLDYQALARAVAGLIAVVKNASGGQGG